MPAIAQRQVKLESLRARGRDFTGAHGTCHSRVCGYCCGHVDLRGVGSGVEHFADLAFEVAKVEGLLEEADAGVQHAVVSDYVFGVAGHVQDFHVGANLGNALGQFAAIHAGHDDVSEQQVDDFFVGYGNLHGDRAVGGFDHYVALLFQILAG